MINIRKKLKQIQKSDNFAFIILFIAMIIFHSTIKANAGDDVYFSEVLKQNTFLEWLQGRYAGWSSRIIIEAVMVIVLGMKNYMWNFIDVAIVLLLALSISKIFIEENFKHNNWIIVMLIFIYPFTDMHTAGWGATTLNYLWPLSLGIYSFIVVKKKINNKNVKWYEYIFSTLALIFAVNQEQMCAILLAVYCLLAIYIFIKNKPKSYIIFQTIICFTSIIFITTCPGNIVRKSVEISRCFPDYNMLSLINKLELGFSSSISRYVFKLNIIFIIFSLLIFITTIIKYEDRVLRIISTVPLISAIFFPSIPKFFNSISQYGIVNADNFSSLKGYILIILIGMICVCSLLSLFFCFENKTKSFLVIYIFLLGAVSRIVMGFSPTIWASDTRTFIFMDFSLIINSIIIYIELYKCSGKDVNLINYIIAPISLLMYINILFN